MRVTFEDALDQIGIFRRADQETDVPCVIDER